ncbi:hypothetical protein CJ030_MR1G003363 [Morella rubra]|uniref:Uncharacterized protein n=1 Tax=Morella rubra TaxID=262757 RepID=A0A6A1WMS5_9ROSI|nr:hypothetical protein CJ030_MR1G003363 [Morella rubra]
MASESRLNLIGDDFVGIWLEKGGQLPEDGRRELSEFGWRMANSHLKMAKMGRLLEVYRRDVGRGHQKALEKMSEGRRNDAGRFERRCQKFSEIMLDGRNEGPRKEKEKAKELN